MKTAPALAVSALLAALAPLAVGPAAADPLAGLVGEKRPLLLFSKSRSLSSLDRQVDLLRELRPELEERDVVVLVTAGNDQTYNAIGYSDLPRGAARALRRRFDPFGAGPGTADPTVPGRGATSGLSVILVGKDGTEKARWRNLVEPEAIFRAIDAMPMRREEMQAEG